jgi:hypothetical protein
MRSQVQVLAGPPPITPGHSAAGGKPGTLAVSLGRAGAARPSRRHPHRPLRPVPRGLPGATATTHRGHPPSRGRQPRGRCGHLALRPPPGPHAAAGDGRSAPRPGLPGRPASSGAAARTRPGPGPPPTMRDLGGVACVRARLGRRPEPLNDAAAPRDLGPFPWCGCRAASACPQCHRLMETSRTRPDGRGGHQPAGHRTDRTPDSRTPDPGRRTQ